MDLLHLDCETHPVTPDDPAPPPVSLQWCLGPAPLLRTSGGEGYLMDADPSWRWPAWTVADLLGPAPDEEATEDDDPVEGTRAPRQINRDLEPVLFAGDDMLDAFAWALRETDLLLCGVNLPYDLLVMLTAAARRGLDLHRPVMDAAAAGRLRGTDVSDKLICVARGAEEHRFGLEALVRRYGIEVDLGDDKHGPGAWRLRYRELERWPGDCEGDWLAARVAGVVTAAQLAAARGGRIDLGTLREPGTWPYHARRYPLQDVILDREVWRRERDAAVRLFGKPEVPDEVSRPVFQLCLHLQSTTGVRTDYDLACAARSSLNDAADRLLTVLVKAGLVRRAEIWTGPESVAEGDPVLSSERPGEALTFVARAGAKGEPNPRGRSALVEREEDGTRELLPLASLRAAVDIGRGVDLTRNMTEVRRRIEEALRAEGHADHGEQAAVGKVWRELPRTETGLIKTDREVLDMVCGLTDDPGLRALGALGKVEKLRGTYVAPLCVDRVVRWRYDVLKDTGRTSASALRFLVPSCEGVSASLGSDPANPIYNVAPGGVLIKVKEGTNFQNFPGHDALERTARALLENLALSTGDELRDDAWVAAWIRRHDPRRMVIARPGRLFVNVDYKAIELACMARVLNVFNKAQSSLAIVINSGKDPHLWTGVRVHPILWGGEELSYADLLRERKLADAAVAEGREPTKLGRRVLRTRKLCKIVNFGFLGAMGATKFCLYAWQGYGVPVKLDVAKALRKAFLETYPEVRGYFDRISAMQRLDLPVVQIGTGRVRHGCTYAAACNSYFQGLAADGAAQAAWLLAWERYAGDGLLALTECTPLVFEHDAYLCEFIHELAEEWQWIDAELEAATLRGAANSDPAVVRLADRREAIRAEAQRSEVADEVSRLMVAGMEVYLRDERRPELSVVVGTDPKVSTRWEK